MVDFSNVIERLTKAILIARNIRRFLDHSCYHISQLLYQNYLLLEYLINMVDDIDDKFPYGSLETSLHMTGMTEKVDEKYGIDYGKIINQVVSELVFHEVESHSLEESSLTIRDLFTDSESLFSMEAHSLLNTIWTKITNNYNEIKFEEYIGIKGEWHCGHQNQRELISSLRSNSSKLLPAIDASWIVMIESGEKTCIGHIVGNVFESNKKAQVVITTRDCINKQPASSIRIYRKEEGSRYSQVLKVRRIKQHRFLKDLVSLKLKYPIQIDVSWKPICLYYFSGDHGNCGILYANLRKGKGVSNVKIQRATIVDNSFCKKEINDFNEDLEFCVEMLESDNSENIGEAFVCEFDGIWQLEGLRKISSIASKYVAFYGVKKTGFDSLGEDFCGTAAFRDLQNTRFEDLGVEIPIESVPWMVPIYVHEQDGDKLCSGILADEPNRSSGGLKVRTSSFTTWSNRACDNFKNFNKNTDICLIDYDREGEHTSKMLICPGDDSFYAKYILVGVESHKVGKAISITYYKHFV
ncbi:hypothetical protein T10_5146 [Trichinella papuae]|uniref:Peptidase S1 domain-containing protein n=1 Tax=Trichinella papuae TaxID=268474 RepID=A0A0V1MT81_9BILA|nr:hypothetical protein T10_5146 [Trichinella papuae]